MSYQEFFRRGSIPALAAIAAASLASYGAQAGTLKGSEITFATQSVTASLGAVTIGNSGADAGTAGEPIVYTANKCDATASFMITFTLPSGVTFTTLPSATGGGDIYFAMTYAAGGIGANYIAFNGVVPTCSTPDVGSAGTVTLGSFSLAGALGLASPNTSAFKMTATVSSADEDLTDLGAKDQLASSATAINFDTHKSKHKLQIEIKSPSLGALFEQDGVVSTLGDMGTVDILLPNELRTADDSMEYPIANTQTDVVITAFPGYKWGHIGSASLTGPHDGDAEPCKESSAGVTGVISGNTITFPNVNLPSKYGDEAKYEVCLVSSAVSGTSVIANQDESTVSLSISQAAVEPGKDGSAKRLDTYGYDGSVTQVEFTGNIFPYISWLRLLNNSDKPIAAIGIVRPDGNPPGSALIDSALAADDANLYNVATIISNAGVANPGHASLLVIAPDDVKVENLLQNTSTGDVSQIK